MNADFTSISAGPAVPLSPCGACQTMPTIKDTVGSGRSWALIQLEGPPGVERGRIERRMMQAAMCPACVERLYREVCGPFDDTLEVAKQVQASQKRGASGETGGEHPPSVADPCEGVAAASPGIRSASGAAV